MAKRLISLFVLFSICLCIGTPAMATENTPSNTQTIKTSATGKMEITVNTVSPNAKGSAQAASFVITQYENNRVTQTVSGEAGGSQLVVTDSANGVVVNRYIIPLSERVVKVPAQTPVISEYSAPAGNVHGYITYNRNAVTGEDLRIRISSVRTKNDTESYVINGKQSDTLAIITGIICSCMSFLLPQYTVAEKIACAIISAFGGNIAGNVIGIAFTETVAVNAYYYDMVGYDATYDRCTKVYGGISRHVLTKSSSAYNDWILEGYTPQNWQDSTYAYWLWADLNSGDTYPGVKSYS